MNLQDYVAIYSINDLSVCDEVLKKLDNTKWQKHYFNNAAENTNKTYEDDLDVSHQNDDLDNLLLNFVQISLNDYLTNIVPRPFKLQKISKLRYNKYEVGANMKIHHDHIHTLFDGKDKGIPILTVLGLLNDDFEGGDFLMFDGKKVNLSAGDIIVFPSNFLYPHAVTTVTKGTRYSFVAWGW